MGDLHQTDDKFIIMPTCFGYMDKLCDIKCSKLSPGQEKSQEAKRSKVCYRTFLPGSPKTNWECLLLEYGRWDGRSKQMKWKRNKEDRKEKVKIEEQTGQ